MLPRLGPMRRQYMHETGRFIGEVSRYPAEKVDVLIADGFKVTRDDIIRLRDSCRRDVEIRRRPEIPTEYEITGALERANPRHQSEHVFL